MAIGVWWALTNRQGAQLSDMSNSLAHRYPRQCHLLQALVLLAALCLSIGIISPIVTLEKFYILENTFSVLSGVLGLLQEGQYFLFLLIVAFSIVLPVLKLAVLLLLLGRDAHGERMRRWLRLMHHYGKWSMLDVFVVALLVVSVKLGVIASVQMRGGLYFFAAAILLTMMVTAWTVALIERMEGKQEGQA